MPTKVEISLDAEQYRKQLDAIIGETRQAAAKMSADVNATANPKVEVAAEVSGKENVAKMGQAIQKLPTKKTVSVQANVHGMDRLNDLRRTIDNLPVKKPAAGQDETSGNKLKELWSGLRSELNDFSGGARKLMSTLLGTGGGAVGIFLAGIASLVKIIGMYFDHLTEEMKEVSAQAERNASNIAEAAAVNEKYRQAGEGALRKLSELSNVEKMSNVQKAEAVSLIAKLTRQYGDLGISIDKTTGRISGLDQAMVKRLEKDKDRRIREMQAQLKELRAARNQQDEIIADAGFATGLKWNGKVVRLGGEQKATEAGQKREELDKQIRELSVRLNEERKSDLVNEYLNRRKAENADLAKVNDQLNQSLDDRMLQDKVNAADARVDKIYMLEERVKAAQQKFDKLQEKYHESQQILHVSKEGSAGAVEARKEMLLAEQEMIRAKEEIYNWQSKIDQLDIEEEKAIKSKLEQSEFELNYQKLIAAGEYDKAAALKQEYELRQQNLSMSEKEKQTLLDQKKALSELNLQVSTRDKAQNLAWSAMEKAGLGREAAEQRALYDAEKLNGGKLKDSQADMVRQLTELTWNLNQQRDAQFGDLSIKTNSLTARGGFQGGAAAPDADKYQRALAETGKSMLQYVQRIETFCRDIGKGGTF